MSTDIETLRKKYMENPPEGMTSQDIRSMSEDDLLDMDYFLNDDELDDDFGRRSFLLKNKAGSRRLVRSLSKLIGFFILCKTS